LDFFSALMSLAGRHLACKKILHQQTGSSLGGLQVARPYLECFPKRDQLNKNQKQQYPFYAADAIFIITDIIIIRITIIINYNKPAGVQKHSCRSAVQNARKSARELKVKRCMGISSRGTSWCEVATMLAWWWRKINHYKHHDNTKNFIFIEVTDCFKVAQTNCDIYANIMLRIYAFKIDCSAKSRVHTAIWALSSRILQGGKRTTNSSVLRDSNTCNHFQGLSTCNMCTCNSFAT